MLTTQPVGECILYRDLSPCLTHIIISPRLSLSHILSLPLVKLLPPQAPTLTPVRGDILHLYLSPIGHLRLNFIVTYCSTMSNCCGTLARLTTLSPDSTMYHVTVHDTATAFLANAGPTLRQHEGYTNIVLAHAEETAKQQRIEQSPLTGRPDLWLCSWTTIHPSSPGRVKVPKKLDLVLACTSSHMGPLPLFITFLGDSQDLVPEFIRPRIIEIAAQLATKVEPSLVFSIFGPPLLVQLFVEEWHQLTGTAIAPGGPWYEARMLQCHASNFDGKSVTPLEEPEATRFRLASLEDLPAVSDLCRQFSVISVGDCLSYPTGR
jgi:hypothetical protein